MQPRKEEPQELWRRARWDRIFGALAFLILLLVLMISGISSCAKKSRKKNPEPNFPLETFSTEVPTEAVPDNSKAIFLSPSTQEDNRYACDHSVSEENAMWAIAEVVKTFLEQDGYTVYICGEDDDVPTKVQKSNELLCGAHVAIHSNSSGESGNGQGTEIFYNTNINGSLELAQSIYNHVAELTPTEDRGVKDQTQRELYEVEHTVVPNCLLEVEFHDDIKTSQWILDHTEDLAQAITDGIEAYMNIQPEIPEYTVEPATVDNYVYDDNVQTIPQH